MYTYYGLPEEITQAFKDLEVELGRPIFILPRARNEHRRNFASRQLGQLQEDLSLPELTVDQAAELSIIVAFAPENDRMLVHDDHVERVANVPLIWPRLRDPQPFEFRLDGHERPFGWVEPNTVVCAVNFAYVLDGEDPDQDEAIAAWTVLVEQARRSVDDDLMATIEQARRDRIRDSIVELVKANRDQAVTTRRRSIEQHEASLRNLEQQSRNTLQALRTQSQELALLLEMQDGDAEAELLDEYDQISRHPRVTGLDFRSGQLLLTTNLVVMTHPTTGETRNLGRFRIAINVESTQVTMTNLDNPRHGRDHPHVTGGSPCFGGHERQFSELISSGRWAVFLELAFQYLETFNPRDDWGRFGAYWFDHPDWDPDAAEAAAGAVDPDSPVVGHDQYGEELRPGDRVDFVDEEGDSADGMVVAWPNSTLGYAVARDDGRRGGGPDGSWDMEGCTDVTLVRRAAAVA